MRHAIVAVALLWVDAVRAQPPVTAAEQAEAHDRAAKLSAKGDETSAVQVLMQLKAKCEKSHAPDCTKKIDAHLHKLGPPATAALPSALEQQALTEAEKAHQAGNTSKAILVLQVGRDQCRARRDDACEGRVGVGLAESYRAAGRDRDALGELRRAIPKLDRDLVTKARALGSMGDLLASSGDHHGAIPAYEQALQAYGRVEDRRGAAAALRGLAVAYVRTGQVPKAKAALGQARSLSLEARDAQGVAEAEKLIASIPPDVTRPPPPPPPPPPRPEKTIAVERFPNVLAQDRVEVGQEFPVFVSLSDEQESPDVVIAEGERNAAGALVLHLPESEKSWPIRVAVLAPDFTLTSSGIQTITVPRKGSSDRATFGLRARSAGRRSVWVMFSASNGYIGKVVKWIDVLPAGEVDAAGGPVAATAAPVHSALRATDAPAVNDLEVTLRWAATATRSPRGALQYQVSIDIRSPRFSQSGPETHEEVVPADLKERLEPSYRKILARAGRGFAVLGDPAPSKESTIEQAQALGVELWKRYVPKSVKAAIIEVDALARKAHPDEPLRIQILTNDPVLPWELVSIVYGDGTVRHFLGMQAALARAHETDHQSLSSDPVLSLPALRPVAPAYGPPSPWPPIDFAGETPPSLQTKAIPGTRDALRQALESTEPIGLLHFAGHGTIVPRGNGDTDYALVLEGGDLLTASQWPAIAGVERSRYFAFINACEQGQVEQVGARVEGWAPALIESGAAGYVGALWPVRNDGAREFARRFYDVALTSKGRPTVPEALALVRRRFLDTGDPTYLAYVYYGYSGLRLTVAASP